MPLTRRLVSWIWGRQPIYDPTTPNHQGGTSQDGTVYPPGEIQPFGGFYNVNSYITIAGRDKNYTGEALSPNSSNGPVDGALMFLVLMRKDGNVAQQGPWVQIGSSHPVGSWTLYSYNDCGDGLPKIFTWWKIGTPADEANIIRWGINLSNGPKVISQVGLFCIPPGYWRRTPNFTSLWRQSNTQFLNSRTFRQTGCTFADVRSDTSYHLQPKPDKLAVKPGGSLAIALTAYSSPPEFDYAYPSNAPYPSPGPIGNGEQFGGYYRWVSQSDPLGPPPDYAEFYRRWGFGLLWCNGFPSDGSVALPEGPVWNWGPETTPCHAATTTITMPPPPDLIIPDATKKTHEIVNLFESGTVEDNFVVYGSGTPTIS